MEARNLETEAFYNLNGPIKMRLQRTEGCGGLNEVLNQPLAIRYLVSYLAKLE